MPHPPDPPRIDPVADTLRALIESRGLTPGDRLPAERDLMEQLGVGRAALRRGLEHLEREGRIWRHVGKGTFVAHGATGTGDPTDLFVGLGSQLTPVRMMRARLCIEPALAREAAVNASHQATTRLTTLCTRGRAAASWAEYERQDDAFHRAVAEAADNPLLLALFDSLNRVRREVAFGAVERSSLRPPATHSSFAEHDAIADAIAAHDPDAAHLRMRQHLQSVAARLFGEA
ncbi:MAG: FCD domain-containing protein [Pseudomonadota bacterium]